jgi:hypothetical protein
MRTFMMHAEETLPRPDGLPEAIGADAAGGA